MTKKPWKPSLTTEQRENLGDMDLDGELRHFARDGTPISFADWAEATNDPEYKRVAEDYVGDLWVSTVWIGIDMGMGSRMIFETMVFDQSEQGEPGLGPSIYEDRYRTEEAALKGHLEAVAAARLGRLQREDDS